MKACNALVFYCEDCHDWTTALRIQRALRKQEKLMAQNRDDVLRKEQERAARNFQDVLGNPRSEKNPKEVETYDRHQARVEVSEMSCRHIMNHSGCMV